MPRRALFVYDDRMSAHVLSDTHPMKPVRLQYTHRLLDSYGAFLPEHSSVAPAREAAKSELRWFHSDEYIDGVEDIGADRPEANPAAFNFGPGDNPRLSRHLRGRRSVHRRVAGGRRSAG